MAELVVTLLLVAMAAFVWAGFQLGQLCCGHGRGALDSRSLALRTEWEAIERCREVDDVYFAAQEAMRRAEADRRPQPWANTITGEVIDVQEALHGRWYEADQYS